MLNQAQKKEIADFLRKLAGDIESNSMLSFTFKAVGMKPLVVSVGMGGALTYDKHMKNDYEIAITVNDWSKPE